MEHEPVWQVRTVMELGVVVREVRRRRRWTQAELAGRARVSRRWIVALESGQAARAEFGRVLDALDALDALDLRVTFSARSVAALGGGAAETAVLAGRAPDFPKEVPIDADQGSLMDLDAYLATFRSGNASPDAR